MPLPTASPTALAPALVALVVVLLAGCSPGGGGPEAVAPTAEDGSQAAGGASVEVLVDGLAGPTQIARHPDGRLLVAVLGAGGEGGGTGQVLAIDLAHPAAREVLVDGLQTPTGVAATGDALWIVEPTRLLRAPLGGGEPAVVFQDMPNNGRSNGTILALPDGRLLFDTAGRRQGFDPAPGSGTLWLLDPTDVPEEPASEGYGAPVLTGMKHAYAAALLGDGRVAVTEMSDGRFDGERAPDEVVVVPLEPTRPSDGGWPRCIGDRTPVVEFEGTPERCARAVGSTALFEAGATPTGIALAPGDPSTALVALWTRDQVVAVDLDATDPLTASAVVTEAIPTPQHLLADGDRVLVTSHTAGQVLGLRP